MTKLLGALGCHFFARIFHVGRINVRRSIIFQPCLIYYCVVSISDCCEGGIHRILFGVFGDEI